MIRFAERLFQRKAHLSWNSMVTFLRQFANIHILGENINNWKYLITDNNFVLNERNVISYVNMLARINVLIVF